MTHENLATGSGSTQVGVESIRRMSIRFRLAVLVLTFVAFFGLILHNVIPYTPAIPIVLLVNSVLCMIAGTQANQVISGPYGSVAAGLNYANGFARTAWAGGMIAFLWSATSAIVGVTGGKGGVAPHGSGLLLAISLPAAIIALVAFGLGVAMRRRIVKLLSNGSA